MERNQYNRVEKGDLEIFRKILGEENVSIDASVLEDFGRDETEDIVLPPEVVVFPESADQISKVVGHCNERKLPLTPRGAGTGLSGGSIPVFGGVSLSVKKLNRILKIDERNFQVLVEVGVITQVLQEAVESRGLFYPPDPASRGSCFIGGNVAENSGGPKAVKYGVTKDYVLNLEVVLASGEIIWTGSNVLKNATGYNLTQLMVGSEGTLGIVTKAVLKLITKPRLDYLLLVPFYSSEDACRAVEAVFRSGIYPSGLEFMERDALLMAEQYLGIDGSPPEEKIEAKLLIELDGNREEELMSDVEKIYAVLREFKCGDPLFADSAAMKEKLWKVRRCLGEAVKAHSIYKEEDTVVPRAELPQLLKGVKEIGRKYKFRSVCYGHAGDGNLHVNILREQMNDRDWSVTLKEGISEIFKLCVSLGGTISGEHGIGLVQKEFLPIAFNKTQMALHRSLKNVFDPNGILNPGKIF